MLNYSFLFLKRQNLENQEIYRGHHQESTVEEFKLDLDLKNKNK